MAGTFGHDALKRVVYADDPVLLLFAESEEGLGRAREAAQRAGCRIAGELSFAEAPDRLMMQATIHGAVVVAERPSPALDVLLGRIEEEARIGRFRSVVVAPEPMIDAVAPFAFTYGVEPLIDPEPAVLQAEIAAAAATAPARLHDVTRSNGVAVLQQLSEEAARIAATLAALSGETGVRRGEAATGEAAAAAPEIEAGFVRAIIRARRLRDQYFRGELFADPAWDMLLDLFAARLEGNRVAVSSLCIAASVPATTALRWIKALTDRGLFVRSADPQDGRRVYIELSDDAARAMGLYLGAVQRAGATAI